MILCFYSLSNYAQMLNLNDPNLVFNDSIGKSLSLDKVKKIVSEGPFSIKQKLLDNGKTEVVIFPTKKEKLIKIEGENSAYLKRWIGKPFPDFQLYDINRNILTSSTFQDKLVIINFWFTRCMPCIKEMPELNELVHKYSQNKEVLFLAYSFDSETELNAFLEKRSFKYNIIPNSKTLIDELNITNYPTHMIVNDGVIEKILIGSKDIFKNLDNYIKTKLNK